MPQTKKTDYLIIGQGIAGTLLSHSLLRAGCEVLVMDDGQPNTPSRIAGGLINPVTGKRMVQTWLIEELMPYARQTYTAIGEELGLELLRELELIDFHESAAQRELFNSRAAAGTPYLLQPPAKNGWSKYFNYQFGIGVVAPCMVVDTQLLLATWRAKLEEQNRLVAGNFSWGDCKITPTGATYGDIQAKKIICCQGAAAADSPYFNTLPWTKDKGEALIATIPGLPQTVIYKFGTTTIVPMADGLFWIGAQHDWKYTDLQPSSTYRHDTSQLLMEWLRLPATIVGHSAAARPANQDRKPFIGLHPRQPAVGIFSGLGGKGFSLAPYFADSFANHLVHGTLLPHGTAISRYHQLLRLPSWPEVQ